MTPKRITGSGSRGGASGIGPTSKNEYEPPREARTEMRMPDVSVESRKPLSI